jgi:hypothetical protein
MGDIMPEIIINDYNKRLRQLKCREATDFNLPQCLADLSEAFGRIKASFSGYWQPIDYSLEMLLTCVRSDRAALMSACVQQLFCYSELCIGTYLNGSAAIRSESRNKYRILPQGGPGAAETSAVFVFEDEAVFYDNRSELLEMTVCNANVYAILQSSKSVVEDKDICVICAPKRLSLPMLFDLAFYLTKTDIYLFVYDIIPDANTVTRAFDAMRDNPGIGYIFFNNLVRGGILPNFPLLEGVLSGVYRSKAVAEIGSLDCLFSDVYYLCEDYRNRMEKLSYFSAMSGCEKAKIIECEFESFINRDDEAMQVKYAQLLPRISNKKLIGAILTQLSTEIDSSDLLELFYDGENRIAKLIKQMYSNNEVVLCDLREVQNTTANVAVFCFPICQIRNFDVLLAELIPHGGKPRNVIFFDKNYLAGSTFHLALSDGMFNNFDSDSITIYHRKKLRDKIEARGYKVTFSRVTDEITPKLQNMASELSGDVSDTILKNLQTEYYIYVCKIKGDGV